MNFSSKPLNTNTLNDFKALFGKRGACAGCWCTYWQQTEAAFKAGQGDRNRERMEHWVRSGHEMGLVGYIDDQPVGWCGFGSRESYSRLTRSRILKPVDSKAVISLVCFFVKKSHRRQGVGLSLLEAVKDYALTQGAAILEGYPIDPPKGHYPDAFAFCGLLTQFKKAGFREVARRSPTRPIVRLMRTENYPDP